MNQPEQTFLRHLETSGEAPPAGFGHTFTLLSDSRAILFGGTFDMSAAGFQFSNNFYEFNVERSIWTRINQTGFIPSPRAAHAADRISATQIAIFGGTGSSGKKKKI
jgi:protein phosphatase